MPRQNWPRWAGCWCQSRGVDADRETWGGDGTAPLGFFFRDPDGNQLIIVANESP